MKTTQRVRHRKFFAWIPRGLNSLALLACNSALLCCIVLDNAQADETNPLPAAVLARVAVEHVEFDPGWLALLHYHRPWLGGGWKSHADSPSFFLSSEGKRDPQAELLANVSALFFKADRQNTRCRFPARYEWLRRRLSLASDESDDVTGSCSALKAWYEPLAAGSVSIDFASSYLENPSSLFGHTFLRFGTPDTPVLLTPTINYAADSRREHGKLDFIAKGLLGGFPGVADQLPYFRRLRIYSDNEGRTIWEYPLALNDAEIRVLLLHLWEVKDGVFDYYFLDENCSYRTLALIAVARPDLDLLGRFVGDVVPVETIRALHDKGLIDQPVYWPSAPRNLLWHLRGFTAEMRRAVIEIARGRRAPDDLAAWPAADRARILAAAAEYFAILVNRNQLDAITRERVMPTLLDERLSLGDPQPADPPPTPAPPLDTHGGRAASIGAFDRQGRLGIELGYDGFRHTLIDPLAGYDAGAEITVLGSRLRVEEGSHVSAEQFDVLRVQSKVPSTALFQQAAWALHVGAERKYVGAARPLLGSLGYARGKAFDLGAGVLALTLGANIDGSPALRGDAALEGLARVELTRQRSGFNAQAFIEYARYLIGDDSARRSFGLRFGVPLARNLSVDLELERAGSAHDESQALIELRRFF